MSAQQQLLRQLRLADSVGRRVMLLDIAERHGRGFALQLAGALDIQESNELLDRYERESGQKRGRR